VEYYTTKTMKGRTRFKCAFCKHSVNTADFNSANGNRRTQAATEMNQHTAVFHSPLCDLSATRKRAAMVQTLKVEPSRVHARGLTKSAAHLP
jgi:hypothetical protein